MKRVEVRCCCTPMKLLGSLPIMDSVREGQDVRFVVMKPPRAFDARKDASLTLGDVPHIKLTLLKWGVAELETWNENSSNRWIAGGLALKADGVPIETLRRIPGFIEEKS